MKPPWLLKAESYIGDAESNDMSEIQQWIMETDGNPNRESWCADFANHCLAATGFEPTHSPAAASFLHWGVDIGDTPQAGCIVVFQWSSGSDAGGHHVTFYEGPANSENIDCLGGNQNREVKHSAYPVSDVVSYRMPKEYQ
jgi:uncharacterized protein (TIGR02594 family)